MAATIQLNFIHLKQKMLDKIRTKAAEELKLGVEQHQHAFRFASLASIRHTYPKSRNIVLRAVKNDFDLFFYTDCRSNKVKDFRKNPNVSVLFYNHKKLFQLEIRGQVKIISDPDVLDFHWQKIKTKSTKDYTTKKAPGTPIKNPNNIEYFEGSKNFCVIKVLAENIEVLQLKRPNHIRSRFFKDEDSKWIGEFLNP